jgi:hypothetical protein
MMKWMRRFAAALLAVAALAAQTAWGEGLGLGESKEQLKLQYDVSVYDHHTDRVTVTLTIADEGRLKPLRSVDLHLPSQDKHADGRGYMSDLTASLATTQENGKTVVRVHLKKEWAERAQCELKTGTLDGKPEPLTWYYYVIPIAKYRNHVERPSPAATNAGVAK